MIFKKQAEEDFNVSVPYRGATFLNELKKQLKQIQGKVSVPYRGATFLNLDRLIYTIKNA